MIKVIIFKFEIQPHGEKTRKKEEEKKGVGRFSTR